MNQALTITPSPGAALIPPGCDKDTRYRLKKFIGWLDDRSWLAPDLAGYRDWLLSEDYAASARLRQWRWPVKNWLTGFRT